MCQGLRLAHPEQCRKSDASILQPTFDDDFYRCFGFGPDWELWKSLAKAQDNLLWGMESCPPALVGRSWNEWTIGHFASETTSVVSKINDPVPPAPSLDDRHMLLNAIIFVGLHNPDGLVSTLGQLFFAGLTKVCIAYFLALPGMPQLPKANSKHTFIASIMAMILRLLKALEEQVAERLELKMMRHKAHVRSCPSERFAAVLWDEGAKGGRHEKKIPGRPCSRSRQWQRQLGASCATTITASGLTALTLGELLRPLRSALERRSAALWLR